MITGMFQVGDVVQLISGGPAMTVCEVIDGQLVACWWFTRSHRQHPERGKWKLHHEIFPAMTLLRPTSCQE